MEYEPPILSPYELQDEADEMTHRHQAYLRESRMIADYERAEVERRQRVAANKAALKESAARLHHPFFTFGQRS